MERRIAAAELQPALFVLRQRLAAERATFRVGINGALIEPALPSQAERLAADDALMARAQRVAADIAAREVASVRAAQQADASRVAQRKAVREAIGLARLAQMIAERRRIAAAAAVRAGEVKIEKRPPA
jgi:hypothetical protein